MKILKNGNKSLIAKEYSQRRNLLKAVKNLEIELQSHRQSVIYMFVRANANYKTYLKEYNRYKSATANEGDHGILLLITEASFSVKSSLAQLLK